MFLKDEKCCFLAIKAEAPVNGATKATVGMKHQEKSLKSGKLSNKDASSVVTVIYCCFCLRNEFLCEIRLTSSTATGALKVERGSSKRRSENI